MKFRKRPVEIEAFRLGEEWPDWWGEAVRANLAFTSPRLGKYEFATIRTLEGMMRAELGDWIIRGIKGELYPCKPDIFEATYERVV